MADKQKKNSYSDNSHRNGPSGNKQRNGSSEKKNSFGMKKGSSEKQKGSFEKQRDSSGKQNSSPAEQAAPVTEEEADSIRVTVDLEDGSSEECSILTILTVDGHDYIALLPMDADDCPNAEGRVYLYRYFEDENGLPYMDNITDDDEYEAVFDAFDEWQDSELFDSMP